MHRIGLTGSGSVPNRLLALGAHCDDIEIGCGGTMLRLAMNHPDLEVRWVVLGSTTERRVEAQASAAEFLAGFVRSRLVVHEFPDGYLPSSWGAVKDAFEALKREYEPDIIFTHQRNDRHQDHRLISDLTWNTWRNHLILEYEIPKYDGDFGSPGVFAPLDPSMLDRKVEMILRHFRSQSNKHWLTADLLRAVARIRGMECCSPTGLAEAFYSRKLLF